MTDLLSRLPHVRGAYHPAARLAQHTWFGVGGPADVLFCPLDEDDLAAFLAGCPVDIPVTVMGAGSNILVRDGGVAETGLPCRSKPVACRVTSLNSLP